MCCLLVAILVFIQWEHIGGFWFVISKNFRMSGYDNWSWITISSMRVHFETIRHPLFLTILYPLYWLNHWLINTVGINFAVFLMAIIILFSAFYSVVFTYRILREVLELKQKDATLLTLFFFFFRTYSCSCNGPRPFYNIVNVAYTYALYCRKETKTRKVNKNVGIFLANVLYCRNSCLECRENYIGWYFHKW